MTIDDEAVERLVVAARSGDPEAFGALPSCGKEEAACG